MTEHCHRTRELGVDSRLSASLCYAQWVPVFKKHTQWRTDVVPLSTVVCFPFNYRCKTKMGAGPPACTRKCVFSGCERGERESIFLSLCPGAKAELMAGMVG